MRAYDVLLIGAGLAGQRAALAAAEAGVSVGIVSKVHPVRSHSTAAAGGINAALKPGDSWESHAYDTVKGSDYLGDQDAIELMCKAAPEESLHLEHLGVTFHRDGAGELGTRAFGGASAARTFYVADITGQALLHVLYEQLLKHMAREHGGRRVAQIRQELGEAMNRHCAVFRDAEGLATALAVVRRLKEEADSAWIDDRSRVFNQDVIAVIELGHMLDVAEAVVLAALERTESRGAQFRTDFPKRDDERWLKHITVSANGAEPEIGYAPVTITRWQPEERHY